MNKLTHDAQTIDSLTCQAYNEFYVQHKKLFRENPQEYWYDARPYIEEMVRKLTLKYQKRV